jgi:hypothetical protein
MQLPHADREDGDISLRRPARAPANCSWCQISMYELCICHPSPAFLYVLLFFIFEVFCHQRRRRNRNRPVYVQALRPLLRLWTIGTLPMKPKIWSICLARPGKASCSCCCGDVAMNYAVVCLFLFLRCSCSLLSAMSRVRMVMS